MKKIRIMVLWLMMMILMPAFAQDYEWIETSPSEYQPAATQQIINRKSPCNQGEEAFMDFIPKFRTDKKFRDSRMKFEENEESNMMMMEALQDWNTGNGFALFKAKKGKDYYCTWYNVSADQVCFRMEETEEDEYGGGSAIMARFQRIDGKWYITGLLMAG